MNYAEWEEQKELSPCSYEAACAEEAWNARQPEIDDLKSQIGVLEAMRPHWAKGFSSDSTAAQVQTAALSEIWKLLGVDNQTDCMAKLRAVWGEPK